MTTPDRRPSVGLNLTWLVPGVVGGSEEYTIRLLTGLAGIADSSVAFRVYGRRDLFDRYPELADHFVPIAMPGNRISKPRRIAMEQTWLARASRSDDVVHHMGGTVPFVRGPRTSPQRMAVTIHDLQPIDMAQNFSPVKRRWLGRLIPLAVEQSDVVVCPSRFTAGRIVACCGADPSKLRVVHQGYRTEPESTTEKPSAALSDRFDSRRFLLYPAIAYRHKRHRDLVEALARLPAHLGDIELVFCGGPGPETERLREQVSVSGLSDRVHLIGRVPEADLHWLYRHALALTFASGYEGFGNPCLEAMARGCPVLASDAAALPEVIDGAGLLIPPGDVAGWATAIAELADNQDLATNLAERGRERAATFDPAMASGRLWAVYRELLGLNPVTTSADST